MPDAGWYDDPLVPGGKRYWDGAAWTPNVQGPAAPEAAPVAPATLPVPNPTVPAPNPTVPASVAPPWTGPSSVHSHSVQGQPGPGQAVHSHAPPFEAIPAAVSATGGVASSGFMSGGGFGDIGEWMNQTFRALRDNATELFLLFFVIPAVFWSIGYLTLHQFVGELEWFFNDEFDEISGANTSLAAVSLAAFCAMVFAWLIGMLAGHHLLYGAHTGQPTSLGGSVIVALRRLPRLLGIGLPLMVVFIALLGFVPAGIIYEIGVDGTTRLAYVGLFALMGLASIPIFAWLAVKAAFVPVAAAVIPSGSSALVSSFGFSRSRFWHTFARLGILFAMTTTLGSVAQILLQFAAPVLLFSKFETDGLGRVFVDGRELSTIEQLQVGDLLPNPFVALVYLTLFVLILAAAHAVVASGTSALYATKKKMDPSGVGYGNHGGTSPIS